MDAIKRVIDRGSRDVLVVGAGFIGLEVVENLIRRGVRTTLVQLQGQILSQFDAEMTTPLLAHLRAKGVDVILGQTAKQIEADGEHLRVTLTSGQTLSVGMVLMGIGVGVENRLAKDAGLETGSRGGIRVNSHLQTSDPDIYAVGDAIEVKDFVSGAAVQIPLAGPANRQGRLAANHIFGGHAEYRGTQGTAILGIFDMTAAMTGSSERTLQMMKRPYRKVYTHPAHHAGYYPGAEGMTIKLMFDPEDGRILGAQAVGGAGVDKRIDILAMAIQGRMTVYDLEEAELAYAPQYGSAKDPINMIGFVGGEILRGGHPQTTVEELKFLDGDSDPARRPFVIDVRTPTEFNAGHLPGATNVPVDELRSRLNELPREQPLVVYCQVGQRGYLALRILLQNGFNARNLSGGYKTWLLYQS
jgi:NADPH-dependent 2,4-dienoyl-CoA reductase/sulfur reductase-like enzyme/rhodanese-related sulfurtransferase